VAIAGEAPEPEVADRVEERVQSPAAAPAEDRQHPHEDRQSDEDVTKIHGSPSPDLAAQVQPTPLRDTLARAREANPTIVQSAIDIAFQGSVGDPSEFGLDPT
jgi:hypothetical protein